MRLLHSDITICHCQWQQLLLTINDIGVTTNRIDDDKEESGSIRRGPWYFFFSVFYLFIYYESYL